MDDPHSRDLVDGPGWAPLPRATSMRPTVTPPAVTPSTVPPRRLVRRKGGAVIGGVCGGVADHLGADVTRVRIVFALLTVLGVGLVAYVLLWFLCPPGHDAEPVSPAERRRGYALALAAMVGGAVVTGVASERASFVLPVVVVGIGAALVWREVETAPREPGARLTRPSRARMVTWVRMLGGATLVVVGLAVVLLGRVDVATVRTSLIAVVLTLIGAALLTVPLWLRLWRDLNEERAARVRTVEREEIASHLHDSVLQTLALIQKQAGDATQVRRLARGQERELREWLFGDPGTTAASLAAALKAVAGEVEDDHGLAVTVVTVGDVSGAELGTDDRYTALLGATREALVNAAKHSGVGSADVYVEVTDGAALVFVRDRGVGFDPAAVPSDRQGLAKSVRARIERRGGDVTIRSGSGRGTEVQLSMPRPDGAGVPGGGISGGGDGKKED
jgi:signal transduction histidine kinase